MISLLWDTQNSHTDRCNKHIIGDHGLWNWARELLCNWCRVLFLDDDKFMYLENGDECTIICKVYFTTRNIYQWIK